MTCVKDTNNITEFQKNLHLTDNQAYFDRPSDKKIIGKIN